MNVTATIIIAAAAAGFVGARLGMRRMVALAIATGVAASLAPAAGPALARWSSSYVDWDNWVRVGLCWSASYLAIFWTAAFVAMRILNRGRSVQKPSVAGRLFGAGVAAAVGALCAAMAVGNLADVVLEQLPADHASPVLAAVRRPVEVVRACRLLATVTGPEAEILLDRGDIRGVLESESIDRLLRTPGVVRKVSRAADGDWAALATLAADPAVKEFMNEGDFLDRIRALDMVSMADDIRRRRSTGEQLAAASARAAAARGSVSSPPRVLNESWARRIAEDPQLRDRVLAEWFDERKQPAPRNASPPQTAAHPAQATPAEVEAYWRKVGALLEFADGPNLPASLIPGFSPPAPEPAK